ncbi:hypothetical protein PVK06_026721 [Gossypium arboreum]|uniref:Uncharacterized protein n=1 Tax=Gossypium arboreum TaxID=29729 RepID=A0ABR0P1W4_GOSAR|nr:hypothetical protein PVK06_026721 [Gossypium arboreum]
MVIGDERSYRSYQVENDPLNSSVEAVMPTSSNHSKTNDKLDESKKNGDRIETKEHCKNFDQPQPSSRVRKNYYTSDINCDIHDDVQTRGKPRQTYKDIVRFACYTSQFEPK